jgi:hypothetical protein
MRAPLISARRSLRRMRFFACGVFAMLGYLKCQNEKRRGNARTDCRGSLAKPYALVNLQRWHFAQ